MWQSVKELLSPAEMCNNEAIPVWNCTFIMEKTCIDPSHFAYEQNRAADDSVLTMNYNLSFAKSKCICQNPVSRFSLAFNTMRVEGFVDNTNYIFKKCMQRLFLIQRISRFGVSHNILEIAYKSLVESVLTNNLISWYGHLNCKQKNSLAWIINIASKITGRPQSNLGEVYTSKCVGKAI